MTALLSIVIGIILLNGALIIWFSERPLPLEFADAVSDQPLPPALVDVLKDITHPRWHSKIALNARLLHDLRILGDDVDDLWVRLDPEGKFEMSGFDFDDYFPFEAGWHSFFITVLSVFGRDYGITKKYRKFPVRYLVALKFGKSWRNLHPDATTAI
jgi:hypothetical protein